MVERYNASLTLRQFSSAILAAVLFMAFTVPGWAQTTVGPNNAGTGANVAASVGNVAWTNPGNAVSSNNSNAIATTTGAAFTQYLQTTNYGFSIPNDAVILGITVSIERTASNNNAIRDNDIRLLKNSSFEGNNKSSTAIWSQSEEIVQFGGASDLWGGTWSPSDINNTNFGVSLRAERYASGSSTRSASIDAITVSVTYSLPDEGPGDPEIGEEARPTGVYRSVKTGTWSDPTTWEQEMIDDDENTTWVPASQFPSTDMQVIGSNSGTQQSASATHAINMPANVAVGEMLIVAFSSRFVSNADIHIGTGWTKLDQAGYEGSGNETITGAIFYKIASGDDALTVSTSSNVQSSHVSYRVSGAKRVFGTAVTGNDDEPNPPLFAPSSGAGDYLWLATAHLRGNVSTTGNPDQFNNSTGSIAYSGANGTSTTVAHRSLNASSLDPTTFSADDETAWVSFTLVLDAGDPAAAAFVRDGHIVTTTADVNVLSVIVEDGGTLVVNDDVTMDIANGSTMEIEDGGTLDMLTDTSLTDGPGSFDLQSGGTLKIGSNQGIHPSSNYGNIQVDGGRLYSTGGYYVYQGNSTQDPGSGLPSTVAGLGINNTGFGMVFLISLEVTDQLTLTQGIIHLNNNVLTVSNDDPSAISGGSATSFVSGELRREIATGIGTYHFPIGSEENVVIVKAASGSDEVNIPPPQPTATYAPVSVTFKTGSSSGVLAASTSDGDSESLELSKFNSDETVNRTWTVVPTEGLETVDYDITLNWDADDEDEEFDVELGFVGKLDSGEWTYPEVDGNAGTSITATGLSSFSDFQVGSQSVPTILTEPVSALITYGDNTSFEVVIDFDDADAAFQWQVLEDEDGEWTDLTDDATYSGSSERTLTLTIPLVSMTGYKYRVNVTCAAPDECDVVTSNGEAMLTVAVKDVTIIGLVAADKVYDATTFAFLNNTNANLVGVIPTDVADIGFSNLLGEFNDANVGEDKPVTTNLVLTGLRAANYLLTQPTDLTATITPAFLIITGSFTANDKPFDENTNATFASNNLVLSGIIGNDEVSLTNLQIDFDDAFFDGNQPVRITAASLSGPASANYELLLDGAPTAEARIIMFRIFGYKFNDLNGNGTWENGEPGIEGWTILIQGSSGSYTETTDESGFYAFDHILPGNYQVREVNQDGWVQSAPGGEGFANVVVSTPRTLARVDFGNWKYSTLSGSVFKDLSGEGVRDAASEDFEGVTVVLRNLSNVVIDSQVTGVSGEYEFDDVAPGHYYITASAPEGYSQSLPGSGGGYNVIVTSGSEQGDYEFGLFQPVVLTGYVYLTEVFKSTFGDGSVENSIPSGISVSGVRTGPAPLKLAYANSSFEFDIPEDGFFYADNLLPGMYEVQITLPEFYYSVTENPIMVELNANIEIEIAFGIAYDVENAPEATNSSISGTVFFDADGSGSWSTGETGIGSHTVNLIGRSLRGNEIERMVQSDNNGSYIFSELPAGSYTVEVGSGSGMSGSIPMASHLIKLGDEENVGMNPMAAAPVSSAPSGSYPTYAILSLAVDTDMDGVADTRVDVSGAMGTTLSGFAGQSSRTIAVTSFFGQGSDSHGHPSVVTMPGMSGSTGTLTAGLGSAQVNLSSGFTITLDGNILYASSSLALSGTTSTWPLQTGKLSNANQAPVTLRNPFGAVKAQVILAEIRPMRGMDLGVDRADYGDAPTSYGTLRATLADQFSVNGGSFVYASDGARHLMPLIGNPSLMLGTTITADSNGKPSDMADADSDDGVDMPSDVSRGSTLAMDVTVTGVGKLSAWADWNRDGSFGAGEQVLTDVDVDGSFGVYNLSVNVPTDADEGLTFVRFRLTTQAGIGSNGMAVDGEVEDYAVTVGALASNDDDSSGGDGDGDGGTNTSDREGNNGLPTEFSLGQNYPNPFNPTTVIPFTLAAAGDVSLSVYDVTGRQVAMLKSGFMSAGRHTVTFNAAGIPSGVYIVRLEAGGQLFTSKLTLLK